LDNVYHSRFTEVSKVFSNRKLLTIQSLVNDLETTEEVLGFQFWLSDEVGKLTILHKKEWENIQKQLSHQLYDRNLHYLFASYELACAGLCDPSYNNIRTVHESIIKMYFLWAFPETANNVLNDMEPIRRPEFGHEAMINKLYSVKLQESMRQQFRELSGKSHSNYTGIATTLRYSVDQIKDCLWFIRTLSFYNIITEMENQSSTSTIIELPLAEKVGEYLEKLRKNLTAGTGTMATYFPDIPTLASKLKIRIDV